VKITDLQDEINFNTHAVFSWWICKKPQFYNPPVDLACLVGGAMGYKMGELLSF
jgi:hypothetical protein